ncbi:hypothetical protein C0J52_17773 [Blattella germanica]|nr:hypothetical protein C0J52_17773 [Blattella germanica]
MLVSMTYCFKLGITAMEIHGMLVQVYGVEAVSKKSMFECFKHLRDEKKGVEDELRLGRPSTSITLDNIGRVQQMIVADSPDLAMAHLFLFPHFKLVPKRITMMLRAIAQEAFSDSFQHLYNRYEKCVKSNGEYFEGQ